MTLPEALDSNRFGWLNQTETDLKSLVAEVVVAAMDAWESKRRKKNPRRVFRLVDNETHAPSDQQVLSFRNKYSRVYQKYVKPTVTCHHWPENQNKSFPNNLH